MWAEADFYALTKLVHHLLGSGTVHLLLGCPDRELRHPLLELFPSYDYHYVAGSSNITVLLHDEHIRALCDMAIQTGHLLHDKNLAVAPLERPAGILGLFVVTDPEAFDNGEQLLLRGFLTRAAYSLERNLLRQYSSFLRPHVYSTKNASPLALQSTAMTDEVIITHATDAQEQKDEFISIVSHELRMPLTSIKGYAELLRAYGVSDNRIAEMTPARQRRYLSSITEQAEHLEVLIGDLLDMSRIQAGRLALRFTEVDVARLCRRVAELAQQRVDDEQYCIRCLLDEQLPLAWVDPDRLQQVLTNLLENAIKYSPDGGTIELLASASNGIVLTKQRTLATTVTHNSTNAIPTSITQLPSPELPMLHIMVRDQGIGISEQQQSLLFQPYSRLEHSATDRIPGVGLGLYIARKLVEAMHGRLTLQSSEGEGTCVSITLPGIPDGCHASSFH